MRDGFNSRLLLYAKRKTGIPFSNISKIKEGVWLASSAKENWVIKEFSTPEKLTHQILLTKSLKKHGFKNTYQFHPLHKYGPCFFENRCIGFLQYIDTVKDQPFHYASARNRADALALLSDFHCNSSKCVPELKDSLNHFNLLEKWEKRLGNFKKNFQSMKELYEYAPFATYSKLGEYALRIMKTYKSYFVSGPHCVLHGDLAHHNFIRKKDGELYLIDFDLMSIGPKQIDILQYCNRILPEIDWSPFRLFDEGEAISQYQKDIPFLAALIYPADIYREWNYFVHYDKKKQRKHWKHLKDITLLQYDNRMQFSKWLIGQIESTLA